MLLSFDYKMFLFIILEYLTLSLTSTIYLKSPQLNYMKKFFYFLNEK
jgi:hypothetical protein